jgi:hypothetical protein
MRIKMLATLDTAKSSTQNIIGINLAVDMYKNLQASVILSELII